MYFPKISNVNGMTEKRKMIKPSPEFLPDIPNTHPVNVTIGGIKDIDCNTKSNLLII